MPHDPDANCFLDYSGAWYDMFQSAMVTGEGIVSLDSDGKAMFIPPWKYRKIGPVISWETPCNPDDWSADNPA